MSKRKPWPTVANEHRREAIFSAGEIKRDISSGVALILELRTALREGNVRLALSIASTLEARLAAIGKTAQLIEMTLETAPSEIPKESGGTTP